MEGGYRLLSLKPDEIFTSTRVNVGPCYRHLALGSHGESEYGLEPSPTALPMASDNVVSNSSRRESCAGILSNADRMLDFFWPSGARARLWIVVRCYDFFAGRVAAVTGAAPPGAAAGLEDANRLMTDADIASAGPRSNSGYVSAADGGCAR